MQAQNRQEVAYEQAKNDVTTPRVRARRPDMQLYVPRARRKDPPSCRIDKEGPVASRPTFEEEDSIKDNPVKKMTPNRQFENEPTPRSTVTKTVNEEPNSSQPDRKLIAKTTDKQRSSEKIRRKQISRTTDATLSTISVGNCSSMLEPLPVISSEARRKQFNVASELNDRHQIQKVDSDVVESASGKTMPLLSEPCFELTKSQPEVEVSNDLFRTKSEDGEVVVSCEAEKLQPNQCQPKEMDDSYPSVVEKLQPDVKIETPQLQDVKDSSHQEQSNDSRCKKAVKSPSMATFLADEFVSDDTPVCNIDAASPGIKQKDNFKSSKSKTEDEDNTWETLYNEDGECLVPELMNELTDTFGKVTIQKPRIDYLQFQPSEPLVDQNEFGHVIEIYDFPAEFKTQDLLLAFSQYRDRGFDIKWVDDTHALGLFSSPIAAGEALSTRNTMLKTRPLSQGCRESKLKARRCGEFLQPYKQRPETSATLARRLVTGALGLQVRIPKEQREKERQLLKEAREKKKQLAKKKNDIWEGIIT